MKASCLLAIVSVLCVTSPSYCIETTGVVELTTGLGTNHVTRIPAYFYSSAAAYVHGGLTFTYPSGLFTQTPTLLLTLSLLGRAYSPSELVVAEVVSTTSVQATVRVNVGAATGTFPTISEANTNDVTVYIRAVGL
jgi:hypothetical protein